MAVFLCLDLTQFIIPLHFSIFIITSSVWASMLPKRYTTENPLKNTDLGSKVMSL